MSQWSKGVDQYAKELLQDLKDNGYTTVTLEHLLNGAQNWSEYSWSGCSLIYNDDIAERLATPSEIKQQTRRGGLSSYANANEQWLDTQARALSQASREIMGA